MSMSVIDKEASLRGFVEIDGDPDEGNSVTNALYWIATRPLPGSSLDGCQPQLMDKTLSNR